MTSAASHQKPWEYSHRPSNPMGTNTAPRIWSLIVRGEGCWFRGGMDRALGEGLLEEGGEFLQLVVVQHPIPLAILGDVLGFQHPAVLSLFQNEVGGLVTGHGSSREIRQKERTGSADRWAGWRAQGSTSPGK